MHRIIDSLTVSSFRYAFLIVDEVRIRHSVRMASSFWASRRMAPTIAVTVGCLALTFAPAASAEVAPARTIARAQNPDPTSTEVSGINVDKSTIPQLEA